MRALLLSFFALCALPLALLAQGGGEPALRVGDTFELRLSGVPGEEVAQVSAAYTVDADGNVNVPYIGKVKAAGLTGSQVGNNIQDGYKAAEIYTNPTITISTTTAARFVNVSGQVRAPQRVAYTPDLTLMKAITAAGDFNDYANRKEVLLSRGNERLSFDTRKILKDPAQDPKLLPGDQITVQQTWW